MEAVNVHFARRFFITRLLSEAILIEFISMKNVLLAVFAKLDFGQNQILNVICLVTLEENLHVILAIVVIHQSNVSLNISAILPHAGLIRPYSRILKSVIILISKFI